MNNTSAPYYAGDQVEVLVEDTFERAVVLEIKHAHTSGFGLVWAGVVQLHTGECRDIAVNDDGENRVPSRRVRPGPVEDEVAYEWADDDVLVAL